ncbi:MAG: serine/threonine protein kinase [Thermoanaerobaculia bacterium]|nr:serine/threonine protein kinase [Thermoanaerobaculia bacterium]
MNQITCLRCKTPFDEALELCPSCGERVTSFQRTYATRLIDGKYQILDRLGVGGMGEIFKVRHIHLNELRVIKVMRPNVAADDQGIQRFLQEARTSTQIKHRNLAMLYDFAQLEDGSYYMVWEFIDGTNIQKWIAQNGPVPPRLTLEIAVQTLHGLDNLHSMGLIHRDVSPENIMLSQDQRGKLLVKVIDFGIAKSLAEGESGHGLTQTGMFLGKLKYASPEQAGFVKEGEHIDPRSDLYSFGIVMYEMLAGRAPFQATNPQGYILKHVTEKPAPISVMNPDSRVPAALEEIIFRSLEKTRDTRFATAADFAAALESIRASIPPDEKYGVGEKMVTMSGAKTLADLPKYTPTTGATSTQRTGAAPARTVTGQTRGDEATVMESNPAAAGRGPTGTRQASNEATVMERFGATQSGAAPTTMEPKGGWSTTAEPTVMERQVEQPRKKSKAGLFVALAAGVGIVVIASILALRKPEPVPPVTSTVTVPSTTQVTATAVQPPPAGQGVLLLSATPWGDLEQIISASSSKAVDLSDEDRSTPARIALAPGKYFVTINGPSGKQTTFDVDIVAGKRTRKIVATGNVNFEELEREVNKP